MIGAATFRTPLIIYGDGVSRKIGEYSSGVGQRALIVTDACLDKTGLLDGLKESLRAMRITMDVYGGVTTEPVTRYVDEGLRVFKDGQCDFIISVGGGSCIDTAKGISTLATNQGKLVDFEGMNKIRKPGIPHVAVPTTAGTGSEVSPTTIITDPDRNMKMVLMSPHLVTHLALIDPLLTVQMPQSVTASSGLDALTHAIEGYISVKAHPITDALALHAIRLISQNICQAWTNGTNIEARANMMIGALEAGMAFCNSSVALVHGMARPLGVYFHIPHGMANAMLLPVVMEFTLPSNPAKYVDIANAMGEKTEGLSVEDAAYQSVKAAKGLVEFLKIPNLRRLGISPDDFDKVAGQMSKDALTGGSAGFNPRQAVPEEVLELYRKAY